MARQRFDRDGLLSIILAKGWGVCKAESHLHCCVVRVERARNPQRPCVACHDDQSLLERLLEVGWLRLVKLCHLNLGLARQGRRAQYCHEKGEVLYHYSIVDSKSHIEKARRHGCRGHENSLSPLIGHYYRQSLHVIDSEKGGTLGIIDRRHLVVNDASAIDCLIGELSCEVGF